MSFKYFLGLATINNSREYCYNSIHRALISDNIDCRDKSPTTAKSIGYWLAHKALTIVCLPANLAAVGLGLAAMALSKCTKVAIKIALYVVGLKRFTTSINTGFHWLRDRTCASLYNVIINPAELVIPTIEFFEAMRHPKKMKFLI